MILSAILLFTLAAVFGLALVILGARYHKGSLRLGLSHAGIALLAFGFLITQIVNGPTDKYNNVAALFFVLTLTGGVMLFALREGNKPPSMVVVTIHAIIALVGLFTLTFGYLNH